MTNSQSGLYPAEGRSSFARLLELTGYPLFLSAIIGVTRSGRATSGPTLGRLCMSKDLSKLTEEDLSPVSGLPRNWTRIVADERKGTMIYEYPDGSHIVIDAKTGERV